jgi:hypothetical protein
MWSTSCASGCRTTILGILTVANVLLGQEDSSAREVATLSEAIPV